MSPLFSLTIILPSIPSTKSDTGEAKGKRGAMTYDQTWGIINENKNPTQY